MQRYQSVPGSPDQVQVVLSHKAGPETVLRAATHGLVLGALQGEGPLPAELEELRHRVRAGKSFLTYTAEDLKWGGERMDSAWLGDPNWFYTLSRS